MKKIFLLLVFCCVTVNMFFPITDEDKNKIDENINSKNFKNLDVYLKNNLKNDSYNDIESYIIVKVKDLIVKNKVEIAKEVLKVVLSNNLDNAEAQDLYVSLEKIKKDTNEVQVKKISFDNFLFSFNIGAIDFMLYQSGIYNEHYEETRVNVKYGLSFDAAAVFYHPYAATGLDFSFDSYFAGIYPERSGTEFFYRIISMTTTPLMKVPLYFCFGFSHLQYNYFEEGQPADVFITDLKSLVIGLKLNRWFFHKNFGIDSSFYYYLVSPFTSYFDAAFDASLAFLYRFYTYKRLSLVLKSEVIGFFLIENGKLENNIKFQISLGMGINEK